MKICTMLSIGLILVISLLSVKTFADEGDVNKGKLLYLKYCVKCHGQEGKGDGYTLFSPPVSDLTSPKVQRKSNAELWQGVHDGLSNTAMGTWRFVLSDEEINTVLAFVRSLAH